MDEPLTDDELREWMQGDGAPESPPDGTEQNMRDPDSKRTTWAPIDLGPILDGEELEPPPTMLQRLDEIGLLYSGKVHSFAGEPESGKSWLALEACRQVIEPGGFTTYLDFEDQAPGLVARLRALGTDDNAIRERFRYVRPDEPLTKAGRDDLDRAMESAPALAVVDGVTEAMTLLGLSPLDNADVAKFNEQIPRRIVRSGAAVVLIDHVTKAKDGRGRWAIGAQHKLAGIDGAAYMFEVLRPFGRGLEGVARIEVTKDRPGFVRASAAGGKVVGELHMFSMDGDRVAIEVRPVRHAPGGGLSPSRQRVLAVLEGPDRPLTVQEIGDRLAEDGQGSPLKRRTIQNALEELSEPGKAVDGDQPGNGVARRWWRL
jgi:hypothetical protein